MINYAYTKKSGKVELDFEFFMELMQKAANNDFAIWYIESEARESSRLMNERYYRVEGDRVLEILMHNLKKPLPFEPELDDLTQDDLADVDSGYQE